LFAPRLQTTLQVDFQPQGRKAAKDMPPDRFIALVADRAGRQNRLGRADRVLDHPEPLAGQRRLFGEVVGVLHAGVGAARAERRDLVRGVADEQAAAVAEALHPPAAEGVHADPFELEGARLAEHRADARRGARLLHAARLSRALILRHTRAGGRAR